MTGSSNYVAGAIAIGLTVVVTFVAGAWDGMRSRSTSDFYVASRSVTPMLNASAIGGEYISAASFLGIAALILTDGENMLWFPVGYTFGYLLLLIFVAAPLRRSGSYTIADFTEFRFGAGSLRYLTSAVAVMIAWLYVLPQFQAAGVLIRYLTGAPTYLGPLLVAVVVVLIASHAGMRSVTFAQAVQFWLRLTALAVPLCFMAFYWLDGPGSAMPVSLPPIQVDLSAGLVTPNSLFATYSLLIALIFGAMGLPHVLVRFYTNPTGHEARTTTLLVLLLLGIFYLLPISYGALGRLFAADLAGSGQEMALVLELPGRILGPGPLATFLAALTAGGAFAALVSASSGLVVCLAGVWCQDVVSRWVPNNTAMAFRLAILPSIGVPLLGSFFVPQLQVANMVGLAFAVASSTFCPLLVLGIWWSRTTRSGAMSGLIVGACASMGSTILTLVWGDLAPVSIRQPAAWSCPLAFATMIVVSLASKPRSAERVAYEMDRLHSPLDARLEPPRRS